MSRWVLGAVALLLVARALGPGPAQDFTAFYVGRSLAATQPRAVYLAPTATSLVDVEPAFRDAATRADPTLPPGAVTGFVTPPAVLLLPIDAVPHDLAMRLWRLAAALGASGSLLLLHERAVPAERRTDFAVVAVLCAPLLAYGVWLGQTSWLLLAAATALVLQRGREDAVAGVLVGLAAGFKITPLLILGPLVQRRRWAAVAAGVGLPLTASLLAALALDPGFTSDFVAGVRGLSGRVVCDFNVASVESALLGPLHGAGVRGWPIPRPVAFVGWAVRIVLLLAVFRTRSALLAAAVAPLCTPLAWTHYLAALPALLVRPLQHDRHEALGVAGCAFLAGVLPVSTGVIPGDLGLLALLGACGLVAGADRKEATGG